MALKLGPNAVPGKMIIISTVLCFPYHTICAVTNTSYPPITSETSSVVSGILIDSMKM